MIKYDSKQKSVKIDPYWNKFIHEAERQLQEACEAEEKLRRLIERKHGLEVVIARFKASRDAGEPWPANVKAGTEQESIPA